METLGYHRLREPEKGDLERFFQAAALLPITHAVLDEAIRLRQTRKMTLGDSLIAGTALVAGLQLVTSNVQDFDGIAGLHLQDPLTENP